MKGDKRVCLCGREFVARRDDHKACSARCRARASDSRRVERLAAVVGDKLSPKDLRELARVASPGGFVGKTGFLALERPRRAVKPGRAHDALLAFIDARGLFIPREDFREPTLSLSAERRARELVALGVLEKVKVAGRRGFRRPVVTT